MKKITLYLFIFSLIVTGCGTHAAQGALVGSQVGSTLGSAIGSLSGGWRGSNKGTIIGMVGGAVVGGAIGNACDKAKERKVQERYKSDYDDCYDNRPARSEKRYSNVSAPSRYINSAEMRNIMFYDADDNGILSPEEHAEVVFEVYNNSSETIYDAIPKVELISKTKHIDISKIRNSERIEPGHSKRFTFYIKTGRKLKDGRAAFRISVCNSSDMLLAPKTEFEVETKR